MQPSDLEVKGALSFNHKTSFQASKGYYIAYPLSILKQPGSHASVRFSSSAISINPLRPELTSSNYIGLDANLRLCAKGEKLSANMACVTCPKKFYSLKVFTSSSDRASCLSCPPEAVCLGGDKLGPKPGFWRLDKDMNSFYACKNENACLGAELEPADSTNTGKYYYNDIFIYKYRYI